MSEVKDPKFTDVQNMLMEIHDKLFPDSKYISPDDVAFLQGAVKKDLNSIKLVKDEELETLQKRCEKLEKALIEAGRFFIWMTQGPYGPSPLPNEELGKLIDDALGIK